VQKGKFSAGMEQLDRALYNVDLPTLGMPTRPTCCRRKERDEDRIEGESEWPPSRDRPSDDRRADRGARENTTRSVSARDRRDAGRRSPSYLQVRAEPPQGPRPELLLLDHLLGRHLVVTGVENDDGSEQK
jgi:hypothetical protein